MNNPSANEEETPKTDNAYAQAGLMKASALKIGGLDMNGNEIKSKKDLANARNALQAAQKALKAGGAPPPASQAQPQPQAAKTQPQSKDPESSTQKPSAPTPAPTSSPITPVSTVSVVKSVKTKGKKKTVGDSYLIPREELPASKTVSLFSHLPLGTADMSKLYSFANAEDHSKEVRVDQQIVSLHPAFVQLGLSYATRVISGSSARCTAFLQAFRAFCLDYVPPAGTDLVRDMPIQLKASVKYLDSCRVLGLPMENFVSKCNDIITRVGREFQVLSECREAIIAELDDWEEMIESSQRLVVDKANSRIVDGDVILTYARSHAVEQTLLEAHLNRNKRFKVIVVDSRPLLEGKLMLQSLVDAGIECDYTLINSVQYVMKGVSKVLLGAHAMLSNGALISRAGTAVVAMAAKSHNKPVLVCCETYKFSKRVQLDAICSNELGNPKSIFVADAIKEEADSLKSLNLTYDLTPIHFISAIVTEFSLMPPTSASVIVREAPMGVSEKKK